MSAGDQRCDGARKALEALRQVPELLREQEDTPVEWFKRRDIAIEAVMAAAGPLPARAEGAMRILAELHVINEQSGGNYDVDDWDPETLMTAERLKETRDEYIECVEQWQAEERARFGGRDGNVFYLGAR